MKTSKGGPARSESGVVMIFVLMAIMLIGAITLTVVQLINADVAGGVRELQADQVSNIAQAGLHYAIGQLQLAGAKSYAGQTITITSGSTTLGTAVIVVNCIDTGAVPPCTGSNAGYRRIVSTGSLPVPGPSRTVVAVVQATSGDAYGICGLSSVWVDHDVTLYADVGSNGSITLDSGGTPAIVEGDPSSPPQFSGIARAVGTITCGAGCASQVPGGATPGAPSPVCPAVTLPSFSPGPTPLDVTSGYTMNSGTGYTWSDITVESGSCSGATPFNDLNIQTDPSNPNAVTVMQVNTLNMHSCTRLVLLGVGKLDLRIASNNSQVLFVDQGSHFGVLPSDTQSTPAPVPASRLTVNVLSSQSQAVDFHETAVVAGTFLAPNGEVFVDSLSNNMYGSIEASTVTFHDNNIFHSDTSGALNTYGSFINLRSWKDQ